MQTTSGTSLSDHEGDSAHRPKRPTFLLWAAVAALVLLLDQGTKWWAQHHLADGRPRSLIGDLLQLHLTHNSGAAFGIGTGYTAVLTAVALAIIVVCVRVASRLGSVGWAVALGLLLGGALGNVADRLFRAPGPLRGHVVDFLELPHWPIFNIADSAITVAAVLFVLLTLRGVHLDGSREGGSGSHSQAEGPGSSSSDEGST
ncbi:MAG: signal peptidase II [Nocardioidaceae bacterium]